MRNYGKQFTLNYWCYWNFCVPSISTHEGGINTPSLANIQIYRQVRMSKVVDIKNIIDEWCTMLCANIAGYARNTISRKWLLVIQSLN